MYRSGALARYNSGSNLPGPIHPRQKYENTQVHTGIVHGSMHAHFRAEFLKIHKIKSFMVSNFVMVSNFALPFPIPSLPQCVTE